MALPLRYASEHSLDTVVFVIDRSRSMTRGNRWNTTRSVVRTWLEHLPIKHAVLVLFNDSVSVFPPDGSVLDLTGNNGEAQRALLLAEFDRATPAGNTNTLAALTTAFSYQQADSILLFSDGEPDLGKNRFDRHLADRVYALCRREGRARPVNTVGVGDYLRSRQTTGFLSRVATETGGAFLGR